VANQCLVALALDAEDILGDMPSQAKWRRGAMDQNERKQ
jgi:hypothetical protein